MLHPKLILWFGLMMMTYSANSFDIGFTTDNDLQTFKRQQADWTNDFKNLGAKLPLIAKLFKSLVTAEVNEDNLRPMNWLVFVEAYSGFMRSNDFLSHMKQVEAGDGPIDPPFTPFLKQVWEEALEACYDRLISLDYPTYLEKLTAKMTSKSAGGDKVTIDFKWKGEDMSLKFTSKIMVWFVKCSKWLEKDEVMKQLTSEVPGLIFSRNVPARDTRAIFAIPGPMYACETWLGSVLLDYLSDCPEFTLAKESNSFIANHAFGLKATGRDDNLIVLTDFSAFDATQKWNNVRKALVEQLRDWAKRKNFGRFGFWESAPEMICTIWEKTRNAVFKELDVEIILDMLFSGENMTISINCLTNKAFFKYFLNKFSSDIIGATIMHKLSLVGGHYEIMGDDFYAIFKMLQNLTADEIKYFSEFLSKCAEECGLKINAVKTMISKHQYEYLKKRAVYGYIIPRLSQIQILCSERVNYLPPANQQLTGYLQLLGEYVSRGGSVKLANALAVFTWNVKRGVKTKDKGVIKWVKLPFSVIHLPPSLGGCGFLFNTWIGSNKDALVALRMAPNQWDKLAVMANFVDVAATNIRGDVARAIEKSGEVDDGLNFLKKVQNFPNIRAKKLNAYMAGQKLESKGIKIDTNLAYENLPSRSIFRAIKDNPVLYEVEYEVRDRIYNMIMNNVQKKISSKRFECKMTSDEYKLATGAFRSHSGATVVIKGSLDGKEVWADYLDKTLIEVEIEDMDLDSTCIKASALWEMFGYHTGKGSKLLSKFNFLSFFVLHKGIDLPPRHKVCPLIGIDKGIRDIMMAVGISCKSDVMARDTSKLIIELKRHGLPEDIMPETLFRELARVRMYSYDSAVDYLVYMGVEGLASEKFVGELDQKLLQMNVFTKTDTYSVSDMITGQMDLSKDTINRLLVRETTASDHLDSIAKAILFAYAICLPCNEKLSNWYIEKIDFKVPIILREIFGNKMDEIYYDWYTPMVF